MSETTLNNLITTLKTEAIDAAEKEAAVIIKAAKEEAQRILNDAEQQQQQLLNDAEKEGQATLKKGESALRQAARDLTVTLRNDLMQLLKGVLEEDVNTNFTPELLQSAMVQVVENIGSGTQLTLSADLEAGLADYVQQRLQTSKASVAIMTDSTLNKRIQISQKGQGWSYEITPETVSALLGEHLSGKWENLLKNAV